MTEGLWALRSPGYKRGQASRLLVPATAGSRIQESCLGWWLIHSLSILRPLRVIARSPALGSASQVCKQLPFGRRAIWLIFAHCYQPSLQWTLGKSKLSFAPLLLGIWCGPQWSPLKLDCSSLLHTMELNLFMLHMPAFL